MNKNYDEKLVEYNSEITQNDSRLSAHTKRNLKSILQLFSALKLQSLLLLGLFGFPLFNSNCCRAWHEHNELLLKKEPRAFQGFQKLRAKYVFVSFCAIFFPLKHFFLTFNIASS